METKNKIRHYSNIPLVKGALGILIAVLLLIPMGMVESLILERKVHHEEVAREISRDWSGTQILRGPFLEVPYSYTYTIGTKDKPRTVILNGTVVFLPEELKIYGSIQPSYKHRGIYQFIVYDGKFEVSGLYKKPDLAHLDSKYRKLRDEDMQWDKAQLKFYVSDIKGLSNHLKINWNGKMHEVIPDIQYASKSYNSDDLSIEGFSSDVNFINGTDNKFSFKMDLKGSGEVGFIPLGKYTDINLKSPWGSPKFVGNYLPNKRNINDKNFDAYWSVSQLNRPIKQEWLSINKPSLNDYSFGVEFHEPVNKYLKSLRAAKYSILFILLTFIALFFVEIITKRESNFLQYILTGLALVLFYSILVSLTEQMSFAWAYFISSVAIIGLISIYSYSISKDFKSSFILFILWSILYGFLFFILQLEELALLGGNIGLFIILAVIMFTSRKLNFKRPKKDDEPQVITKYMVADDKGDSL